MTVGFRGPIPWLNHAIPSGAAVVGYRGPLPQLSPAVPSSVATVGFFSPLGTFIGGVGVGTSSVTATVGFKSLLAFWAGGAGATPGETPVEPPVVSAPGGGKAFRRIPTQRVRLHPLERPDEYGRLVARTSLVALLRAHAEPELFARMVAKAEFDALIVPAPHQDEFAAMRAGRGLPNKQILAFFMTKLHKH